MRGGHAGMGEITSRMGDEYAYDLRTDHEQDHDNHRE